MQTPLFRAGALLLLAGAALAGEMSAESEDWLEQNSMQVGVETLLSGLQYQVLSEGDPAGPNPGVDTEITIRVSAKLIDGTAFRPADGMLVPSDEEEEEEAGMEEAAMSVVPRKLIPGLREALVLMRPGDRWALAIPPRLGYGADGGAGERVPSDSALLFTVTVVGFVDGGRGGGGGGGGDDGKQSPKGFWEALHAPAMGGMLGSSFKMWHLFTMLIGYYIHQYFQSGGDGTTAKSRHILVAKEHKGELVKIKAGLNGLSGTELAAAFGEAAKKFSTCPSGKDGGDLGETSPGRMVPEFEEFLFPKPGDTSKPIGQVLGPFDTKFGAHLILVEERNYPEPGGAKKD